MAGKVILVGAGPGDPGLLTVKGRQALERAEVVVYDRLVDRELLALIPASAERIDVGKNAGSHPVPQHEINRILLEKALEGKRVVRLKGGDCFVFGRGGEELELLADHGVGFEVVPGVTSALAAPAYAGIPATHRDFCASVHIITGHRRRDEALELDYEALTRLNGTLIFLMSVATFGEIARGLMTAGMPSDFPCAIVENGTRPEQRKWLITVGGAEEYIARGVRSPAIFVVGRVCELSECMDWFSPMPLRGRRVLVARPRPDSHRLTALLVQRGARVEELPAPETEWLDFRLPEQDCAVLLTAPDAVDALFARLERAGKDARALAGCRLLCLNDRTARRLSERGLLPDGIGDSGTEDCVALCCEGDEQQMAERLLGAEIRAAWRVKPVKPACVDPCEADFAAFTTLSGVRAFAQAMEGKSLAGLRAACIGPQTAKAARALGMEAVESKEMTLESLVECLETLSGELART